VARMVMTGGMVFDGTGAAPERADVVIEAGRIVELGTGLDGDELVDVSGKTVLPGLIDCHVHLGLRSVDFMGAMQRPFALRYFETAHDLAATLDTGITTVRDAGGASLGVKTAVEQGLVRGPRMMISLTMLSQTGGHGDGWLPSGAELSIFRGDPGIPSNLVDGPAEMRKKVRELVRAGADCIKVATSGGVLSPRDDPRHAHFGIEELDVLVAEATAAGIHVLAHAQGTQGIRNAVEAGIRSIEHGIYLDEETVDRMRERGTWLVPTLIAPQGVLRAAENGTTLPDWALDKARQVVDIHRASIRMAIEAGVSIAFGTDCPVSPHGTNLDEFVLMAELGMTPAEVLSAATGRAAELIGVAGDRGTIARGLRADLVVIDGDAFDFAGLRDRIVSVYKDGVEVGGPRFHGSLTVV
jgi:imidazolonepropionase-like amidohydrolase